MEFNQYSMYCMQYQQCNVLDELDIIVNDLQKIDTYDDVDEYIHKKWKIFGTKQRICFDKTQDFMYVCINPDSIELFRMDDKNEVLWKQGWKNLETK